MIFRIFPGKDTFITNQRVRNVPATGSNNGASEVLEVFKTIDLNGNIGIGRTLIRFDVSRFSGTVPSGTRFHLRMANLQHSETVPTSYDLEIQPLTQDWDEGNGIDVDSYCDLGYANWDRAKSNVFWTVTGALGGSPTKVAHFDQGSEDLLVDVSDIVDGWLSGSTNNGFIVKLSSSLETNGLEYYLKMFSSRESYFPNRRPYLEAAWDDTVQTGSVTLASGDGPFFVNVTNLKTRYEPDELVKLRLFSRPKDWNPAVTSTASYGPTGIAFDSAYYRITNDHTDEVVVPFGTGTIPYTKLSYDSNGNYFWFRMSSLPPSQVYRISFLLDVSGQQHIVDEEFKFRVV